MSYSRRDLDQYLVRHRITGATADYIRRASMDLARDIGTGGYTCVVTEYQSRKMGATVNTESRTAECIYAVHLDFDSTVEAFFEQPPSVDCYRVTKRGHRRLVNYVPDMLVLGQDGPYVAQVKTEKDLLSRVASSEDWIQEEDGTIRDLPAEEALARVGLHHQVISASQLNKLRAANISLLLQSLEYSAPDDRLGRQCEAYLRATSVASLKDLAHSVGAIDLTPLLRLIATHKVFTDLSRFSLTEPDACFVTNAPALLRDDVYDAWRDLCRLPRECGDGPVSRDLLPASKHLARGVAIVDLLDAGAAGRSARRWTAKISSGSQQGQSRVAAATPRYDKSGNRNAKRPSVVLAYAENVIRTQWVSGCTPTPAAMWRLYKTAAEEWHPAHKRVSHPTFRKICDQTIESLAAARGGRRAANAAAAPSDVADRSLKATRPFEMASCDHYLCDLDCIVMHANGMKYAMRPWLTVLRDCYTGSVLAFWLSLRAPSRRSCALIMRQCLRTHGRLPEWLIVDRGADFRSNYFSGLMSHCRVNLMLRPAGHPRFGSEAERFFGQFKDLWLSLRPGNRVNIKEVRAVSGSHRPQQLASLSLLDLWEDLVAFNNWFDHYIAPSSIASPAVLAAEGLERFACSGRIIPYDETFLVASAVDDSSYKVDPRRGIHVGEYHYWHPDLVRCARRSIPVRCDPQDPYRIYALIESRWTTCTASAAPVFDTKHPFGQAVEGVITLDGAALRNIVRDDADRALVTILRDRQEAKSLPTPQVPTHASLPAAAETDYFAEVARSDLASVEATTW